MLFHFICWNPEARLFRQSSLDRIPVPLVHSLATMTLVKLLGSSKNFLQLICIAQPFQAFRGSDEIACIKFF